MMYMMYPIPFGQDILLFEISLNMSEYLVKSTSQDIIRWLDTDSGEKQLY